LFRVQSELVSTALSNASPQHVNLPTTSSHLPQTNCASFLINRLLNDREDGHQHPPFSPEFELDHWNEDEDDEDEDDDDLDDDADADANEDGDYDDDDDDNDTEIEHVDGGNDNGEADDHDSITDYADLYSKRAIESSEI
jgi:hypothetical protein